MIVIFGKTRSGKDTIARYLKKKLGYKFIVSYTDRPIRPTEQNGMEHFFVSEEEMNKLYTSSDTIVKTHIVDPILSLKDKSYKGYRYCTKTEDITDNSIAVLDYNGIVELSKCNIKFTTIFVTSPFDTRKGRAMSTGITVEDFEKRCRDEYAQFADGVQDCADFVIDNSGTLEELYSKVDKVIECIRG